MIAFIVLLALMTGSALTVVAERRDGRGWVSKARSRCPRCGHDLGVRDLVPIASFLLLLGRCRFCHQPIPRWHLAVEAATVTLFLLAYGGGARGVSLGFLLLLTAILLALTVTDLRFWTLPDVLVASLALSGFLRSVVLSTPPLSDGLLGGALGLVLLGSVALATRGHAMGWGDVKLAGAMGLVLGWGPLLLALLLAFLVGGAAGAVLMLLRRATLKSHIPFGPFLTGATVLLLLAPIVFGRILLFAGFLVD